ncbi:MAG: M56 family metallopeptidase [Xenococcaceae cyanobacterium MO_167.B52]|nr:M56 family metallopeptidase [Xenococcaceae cyanobacterium MO_167.B52]
MHFLMILLALAIAWFLRMAPLDRSSNWDLRWQRSLYTFLFPPLLLIMTALAVLTMGAEGQMLGWNSSWFGYLLSLSLITIPTGLLVKLGFQAWRCGQKIQTYPQHNLNGQTVYLLELELPYIAQIGFWQPKLVISRGILQLLDSNQLEAVLAHEQAHLDRRDTFCFFWLGWLRSFTLWLPQTENLWQELLLIREIRADLKATETVEPLVLAESLLAVAQEALNPATPCFGTPLFAASTPDRLTQRIDAMINVQQQPQNSFYCYWLWVFLLLIPWATIPLHS